MTYKNFAGYDGPGAQSSRALPSKADELIATIARMTPYSIDSSDDQLEDAIATLNRLISEARAAAG